MKLVQQNPYRIIGVLADASERDLLERKNKIQAFAKVGREVSSEYDFSFLQNIERDSESINQAFSDIQLDADKVFYSLFWFTNINGIDQVIINNLVEYKDDYTKKAIDILQEITESGSPTPSNFSSFNNLGTLLLSSEKQADIQKGIRLKLTLIESESFDEYLSVITGNSNYRMNVNDIARKFCSALLDELKHEYSLEEISELFIESSPVIRKYVVHKILEQPIRDIEKLVENTKEDREENPFEANEYGNELYQNSLVTLQQIKAIVSEDDLRYKNLADEVAAEMLQCGLHCFLENKEEEDHYLDTLILDLFEKAEEVAVNEQIKEDINENIEGIKDWIQERPQRQKDKEFITTFEGLKNIIEEFERSSDTVENAEKLLNRTRPFLRKLKYDLENDWALYVGLSTRVASNAHEMCVIHINHLQEQHQLVTYGSYSDRDKLDSTYLKPITNKHRSLALFWIDLKPIIEADLKEAINLALKIFDTITVMDIENIFKVKIENSKKTLESLKKKLDTESEGCYIATMAYGNYNHPQVMELRNFRDDFLAKSILGQRFIEVYYKYSPRLVEKLKDHKKTNAFIRKGLDLFIEIIPNK